MGNLVPRSSNQVHARHPRNYNMGKVVSLQDRPDFHLNEWHMENHALVIGQTGMGKSKFLERLMRHLIVYGTGGFALIDPHGDLAEDLLAFAAHRKFCKRNRDILRRIHYLEPSYEQIFHYNPFQFRPSTPVADYLRSGAIRAWLHTKADRIGEVVQRKQGNADFQGMARLQRNLTNVLIAVGSAQLSGRFLPLSDALVLLQLEHPRHEEVYRCVEPFLDADIEAEFRRYHSYKNPYQYLNEVESTINRLRSILSPLVKSIFAKEVNTIDFRQIIQRGDILLLNLRETDYFSADQRSAIGGLFIHEILTVAQNTPREQRKKFTLFIDEAPEFIGADIDRSLSTMRKFKLSVCLAGQNLESFKKGELDLRPKVLSQCHSIVTFQQRWPDDLELLARILGFGNLDFRKHYQVMDRPDGYDFIDATTYTDSFSWEEGETNGFAIGESESTSHEMSQGDTHGHSHGTGTSLQRSTDVGTSRGDSLTRTHSGQLVSRSESDSTTHRQQNSVGGSTKFSESHSHSLGSKAGHSQQQSTQRNTSKSLSKGGSKSESRSKQPLARHLTEYHESPQLLNSVSDQFDFMKQTLHGLGERHAVALLRGERAAVVIQTAMVDEKWSEDSKGYFLQETRKLLATIHPYLSQPNLNTDAQDERLDAMLKSPADPVPESVRQRMESGRSQQQDSGTDADALMS